MSQFSPLGSASAPEALASLPTEEFQRIAEADTRGEVGEPYHGALRAAVNVDRWADALGILKREIEAQFPQREAELTMSRLACAKRGAAGDRDYDLIKQEYERWRWRAIRALTATERHLTEATRLKRELSDNTYARQQKHLADRYREALDAIVTVIELSTDGQGGDAAANIARAALQEAPPS